MAVDNVWNAKPSCLNFLVFFVKFFYATRVNELSYYLPKVYLAANYIIFSKKSIIIYYRSQMEDINCDRF